MKTKLLKNMAMKVRRSFGRFLSLLIIVAVGAGFFAGVQIASPDILYSAHSYMEEMRLHDFQILSTMGLTEADVQGILAYAQVEEIALTYSIDVVSDGKALRAHALTHAIDNVDLKEGCMPETAGECIADEEYYQVGDIIEITEDPEAALAYTSYTVVGTVRSPLYLGREYGIANVADGKLYSYFFVQESEFQLEAYTAIVLRGTDALRRADTYSKSYAQQADELLAQLERAQTLREQGRYQEILVEGEAAIEEGQAELDRERIRVEQELQDAYDELVDGQSQLRAGQKELDAQEQLLLEQKAEQEAYFQTAEQQITEGITTIETALTAQGMTIEQAKAQLPVLEQQLADLQAQMEQLPIESEQYLALKAQYEGYQAQYQQLKQMCDTHTQLQDSLQQLQAGKAVFQEEMATAEQQIADAKKELRRNRDALLEGWEEYYSGKNKAEAEFAEAQKELEEAQQDLLELEHPTWYIQGRDGLAGYSGLKDDVDKVTVIATVFPPFFLLIAALMSLNTMTRMIEEERSELGILASLGYSNASIIGTYLLYVLTASIIGILAGYFLCCDVIPRIIYACFESLYILPKLLLQYDLAVLAGIVVCALTMMTGVTIFVCRKALKQVPAALLRPIPPKKGKAILLERVGLIWNRLSFIWKVTMRNMFRYKKRVFMTIVGISGCAAILLTGFGIRDSIDGVAQLQYGEVFRYDNMILLSEEYNDWDIPLQTLMEVQEAQDPLLIHQMTYVASGNNDQELDSYVIVPQEQALFEKYFNLMDVDTAEPLTLQQDHVIVTQKIASEMDLKVGDTVTIRDTDGNQYALTIGGIAKNYVMHYIYMQPALYEQVTKDAVGYNVVVSGYEGDESAFAEELIDSGKVTYVSFTSDGLETFNKLINSMNQVIILIVAAASLLALIVLYNLISINISERIREIATLKVLGFYDTEVNEYIYRETLLLTLFSIGIGLGLGVLLHRFVMTIVEVPSTVFLKVVGGWSFLWVVLIMIGFTLIMQLVTYFKLKRIDMIESLKSVE